MKKEKFLVTGSNGFIGSHVCNKLVEQGYEVVGLDLKEGSNNKQFLENVKSGKIKCLQGNIVTFDFSDFEKVDYIIHISGKVGLWGPLEDFMNVNYDGTKNILNYVKRIKPKCFTYYSSSAVYGFGYVDLKEDAEKRPFNNPYSISKLATENMVIEECKEMGQDYVIIRPCNVYGEYDYTSSHEIFGRIKHQKMMICAGGKYKSCFVYAGNLADATILATTKKEAHNNDYNVSDGWGETLKEYCTMVAKEFGVKPKFTNFPAWLAKYTARVYEGVYKMFKMNSAPLITKFTVWQNCSNYHFCIDKIKSIGHTPKVSLEEGIKRTVEWYNEAEKEQQEKLQKQLDEQRAKEAENKEQK